MVISISAPPELIKRIKELAWINRKTMSAYVADILQKTVKEEETKK